MSRDGERGERFENIGKSEVLSLRTAIFWLPRVEATTSVFPLELGVGAVIGIRITSVSPSRVTLRSSAMTIYLSHCSVHHRAVALGRARA